MTSSEEGATTVKVVIVAGATRGIGRAVAGRLARDGWSVVVNYAHDQRLAELTVEEILASGGIAETVRADVTDELDVERLFYETTQSCGGVDAVVQAVVGPPTPPRALAEVGLDEFEAQCQSRTRASFLLIREAARHLRGGGAVVNVTSVAVTRASALTVTDSSSMAAVDAMTRVGALELTARDITVNAVALDLDGPSRLDQVADAVAYLLSERAREVSGQVVRMDRPDGELAARRNGRAVPN